MPIEIVNKFLPLVAMIIFILLFIYVRKSNPENKTIRTRTSIESLGKKEICPRCGIKMEKKWVKKSLGLSEIEFDSIYEEEMQPEFECKKCGYKVEAKFRIK